jgi:hypothetical protein
MEQVISMSNKTDNELLGYLYQKDAIDSATSGTESINELVIDL